MENEIKSVLETQNKLIEAIRSEKSANDAVAVEKMAKMEADLAKSFEEKAKLESRLSAMETIANRPNGFKSNAAADEYAEAFKEFLRKPSDYATKSRVEELAKKSVNVTTPANGAVAVPAQMAQTVADVARDYGAIRRLAKVVTVGTPDYKEILGLGTAGGEWVGDLSTRNVTADPTFKEIVPAFGEIAARVHITTQAVDDMFFNIESYTANELAKTFAQMEAAAFVNGDGANKPRGVLFGTDVTTIKSGHASTLGAAPADTLFDLAYSIKAEYRSNANFVMNSTTMAALAKLKATDGHYLLNYSLAANVPSTLIGYNVAIDENMPSVAAGAKAILFGDFSRGVLVADRIGFNVLVNPYKISGMIEIEGRKRVGATVADANALKALVISA